MIIGAVLVVVMCGFTVQLFKYLYRQRRRAKEQIPTAMDVPVIGGHAVSGFVMATRVVESDDERARAQRRRAYDQQIPIVVNEEVTPRPRLRVPLVIEQDLEQISETQTREATVARGNDKVAVGSSESQVAAKHEDVEVPTKPKRKVPLSL